MMKQLSMIAAASLLLAMPTASAQSNGKAAFEAPDGAWRVVDPENLMLIDTDYGRIGVELFPDVSPRHTTQIRTLVRQKFYDGIFFHRVIEGFMNQTGDPTATGTGDSDLPDIEAEFTFRRDPAAMPIEIIDQRVVNPLSPERGRLGVGFYNGLPVTTQPNAQAWATKDGKVEASGLHCKGVTSMARNGQNVNSGNSQFFLMRTQRNGQGDSLNQDYSVWGNTVMGLEFIDDIRIGVNGETANFTPDKMNRVIMAADLPVGEQFSVKVLKTAGADYTRFLETQKKRTGAFRDICDIRIPTRVEK